MSDESENWDPAPQEREWFRENSSGNLGWRVRRNGTDRIKLDRANQDLVVPFRPQEWTPENERRPLTVAQVAQIAFEADRRLILYTHNPGLKKQWVDLREEEKIEWMTKGPKKDPIRRDLYQGIFNAMKKHFR